MAGDRDWTLSSAGPRVGSIPLDGVRSGLPRDGQVTVSPGRETGPTGRVASIIIPLRASPALFEWEERLARILATIPGRLFETLVVDYGTPAEFLPTLQAIVRQSPARARVIRAADEGTPFSIGMARDAGVMHAAAPVVLFNDVDFVAPESTYEAIAGEILRRDLASRYDRFFCVPVLFLGAAGTQKYLARSSDLDLEFHHAGFGPLATLEGPASSTTISYGSSCMVANRLHYLAIGGHDKSFSGHGAEDFELMHRIYASSPKVTRPPLYYVDLKDDQLARYRGFRAAFATFGIEAFQRGLFLVHLFHEPRPMKGYNQLRRNFGLLRERMQRFDASGRHPPALPDRARGRTLVLASARDQAEQALGEALRQALPLLGTCVFGSESELETAEDMVRLVAAEQADRVLLLDRPGSPKQAALRAGLQAAGTDCITFGRGDLPDSWVFDPEGSGPASSIYRRERWDRPLSPDERRAMAEAIGKLGQENRQGAPAIDPRLVRQMIGAPQDSRILVAAGQPRTVLDAIGWPASGDANFRRLLQELGPKARDLGWHVILREGPVGEGPTVSGVVRAPPSLSLGALLGAADAVLVPGGEAGLIAAALGKPVLVAGEAAYAHDGIAVRATSIGDVLRVLGLPVASDPETVLRFVHYLRNSIYSFGSSGDQGPGTRERPDRPVSSSIAFSEIRGLTPEPVFLRRDFAMHPLDSPVFAPFGGASAIERAMRLASLEGQPDSSPASLRLSRWAALTLYRLAISWRLTRRQRRILREAPQEFLADRNTLASRLLARLFRSGPSAPDL